MLFAGLKGAVPILLGDLLLTANLPDAERLYGIVVVVVIFSVVVQGSLVPTVARRLGVPMQPVRPEPWALNAYACKLNPRQRTRSTSPPDPSLTAEPSKKSPNWPATSGSASSYEMGRCCPCTETPGYAQVTR